MSLTLWDVGGAARKLWKHYYDKVDGIIFVVDSTDLDWMKIAKSELQTILHEEGLNNVPMLILANKQDAETASSQKEISEILELKDISWKDIIFHGCSAKTGDFIWESIAWLADLMDLGKKDEKK